MEETCGRETPPLSLEETIRELTLQEWVGWLGRWREGHTKPEGAEILKSKDKITKPKLGCWGNYEHIKT